MAGAWALLVPVLILSGGEVLTVTGNAGLAAQLPGNAALVARYRLPRLHNADEVSAGTELSLSALRESPVVQPALSWLAFETTAQDPETDLVRLSDSLGWRDPFTQERLYNFAINAREPTEALIHADALLEQGKDLEVLSQALATGVHNPGVEAAMHRQFAVKNGWSARWLQQHGADLSDDALIDLAGAQAQGPVGLPRATSADLLRKLLHQSRFGAARALWALLGNLDFTGVQPWPEGESLTSPTPFDWKVRSGLSVLSGGTRKLLAERITPDATADRQTLLPAGAYTVNVAGAPGRHSGWHWAIGCGGEPRKAERDLGVDNRFTVPAGCPLQWLAVTAVSSEAMMDELPPLRILPVR